MNTFLLSTLFLRTYILIFFFVVFTACSDHPSDSITSDCIDTNMIDSGIVCTTDWNPVCGCDSITYSNSCVAEAAGIIYFTTGSCSG